MKITTGSDDDGAIVPIVENVNLQMWGLPRPHPDSFTPATERYDCPVEGCDFWSKYKANLKRHMVALHDQCQVWYVCQELGCGYRAKRKCHLKGHLASVHGKGLIWYRCGEPGCDYKAKRNSDLAAHHSVVHDKHVTWYSCPHPGCKCRAKSKASIRRHMLAVHGITASQYACIFPGCGYWGTTEADLQRHTKQHYSKEKAVKRRIGSDVETGEARESFGSTCSLVKKDVGGLALTDTTESASLAVNEEMVADEGALEDSEDKALQTMYRCRINDCAFTSASKKDMYKHIERTHLEGNIWYRCTEVNCGLKCRGIAEMDRHTLTCVQYRARAQGEGSR